MLTPRFKLTQNENHVIITIHAPYTNIKDTKIDISGKNFLFASHPYFLRLELPGELEDCDQGNAQYEADSGDFNIKLMKLNQHEYFENLDMITSLIAPRQIPDINPTLVQALEEGGVTIEPETEPEVPAYIKLHGYGFANKYTSEFKQIGMEYKNLFELPVPEKVSMKQRFILKNKHEYIKFCNDHYLADLFEKELIDPYLEVQLSWNRLEFPEKNEFTDEEINVLKDLPNKMYLLTSAEYNQLILGIVDILFAYCYDRRTTWNEGNVESSWTVSKLSATLSWFCSFDDIKGVLISCYRRGLCYPLFRNFMLCNCIHNDIATLIGKGRIFVIKCFISIFKIFNANQEDRFVFNQLYIRDYLIFLQKCNNDEFLNLSKNLMETEIKKSDLGLDLDELEHAAYLVQQENAGSHILLKLSSLSLIKGFKKKRDSDDDTDMSHCDSSSSSSSEIDSDDEDDDDDDRGAL